MLQPGMASSEVDADHSNVARVGLAITAFLTLQSLLSFINTRAEARVSQIYQDEDGVAVNESQAASSDRSAVNIGAALGSALGLSTALLVSLDWPWVGIWVSSRGCLA
jgi:hypothetical protein